jgi:hypothetical protein
MATAKTLTYWVQAYLSGSGSSAASQVLIDHFKLPPVAIEITTSQMDNILFGDGVDNSEMKTQILALQS